ncbi:MAG: endonuclease [Chitinophagaceae bacterium]|nr:endonuclease [Chitinophagaceae bacterium]
MAKYLFYFLVFLNSINSAYSQCTAPNTPGVSSLLLHASDTQLTVYYDTTSNSPATNIYYLGILSTSSPLSSTPVNGTVYNPGDALGGGNVMFYNKNYIQKQTGLIPGTTYYVYVYAARTSCTGEPFYSVANITDTIQTFSGAPGIPAGYYDAANALSCSNLKTALYNIIKPTVSNPIPTYTGLWSAYFITDDRLNDAATKTIVWDVYTDNPSGTECESTFGSPYQDKGLSGTIECQRYNREHAFPQSWFASAEPMRSDMFIVYPTDKKVNSMRGNFPYGKVTTPTYTSNNGTKLGANTFLSYYHGSAYEPINEYKGDLARSTFYVATAYENDIASWQTNSIADSALNGTAYPSFDYWYIKLMYQWHILDPVSSKETDRNNDIYMIQGNRNPYIDHPEYVALAWQCSGALPVTIIDFTAALNNESVLLKWYATYETQFKSYDIQRSTDGNRFFTVGSIVGRNLANYSFVDEHLPNSELAYYRLQLNDADGKSEYSKTIAIRLNTKYTDALVYPNPTPGKLTVTLKQALQQSGQILITDIAGRQVWSGTIPANQKNVPLNASGFAPGRYFISILGNNTIIHQSFVIAR